MNVLTDHLRAKFYYYFNVACTSDLIIAFLIILAVLLVFEKKRLKFSSILWDVLLAAYLTIVLEITLLGRSNGVSEPLLTTYLIPKDYFDFLFNVIMFIPTGLMLSMKYRIQYTVPLVLLTTCSIEIIQFVTHRGRLELIDIIANFIGGMVGITLYYICRTGIDLVKSRGNG